MDHIGILALIGLPGSGKTTFCQSVLEMDKLPFNILHLNYDNILKPHLFAVKSYNIQRKELLESLQATIHILKTSTHYEGNTFKYGTYKDMKEKQVLILCDDNNYYRSMRHKLYQMCQEFHLSYGQVFFDCSKEIALQRNSNRDKTAKVPNDIIHKMFLQLEPPLIATPESWEKRTFSLSSGIAVNKDFITLTFVPFLREIMQNPLEPLTATENIKSVTTQSAVHNLDLILRKRIGLILQQYANSKINKQKMAQMLNEKKKELLKNFQENSSSIVGDNFNFYVLLLEKFADNTDLHKF